MTDTESSKSKILKRDTFGSVTLCERAGVQVSVRDTLAAAFWARPLARWLAAREARALASADHVDGTPDLLDQTTDSVVRSWINGEPMQIAKPNDPAYFRSAFRLLRQLHRAGIAHNDLAKEPNWLVQTNGQPAVIDFQLAICSHRRGRFFRVMAREDLRHLLKHKRTYCPDSLTNRQRQMLAKKALPARLWMATGKPIYLFVTRRIMGWSDREGAGDRHANP